MTFHENIVPRGGPEKHLGRDVADFEFDSQRLAIFDIDQQDEFAPGITNRGTYALVDENGTRLLPVVSFFYNTYDSGAEDDLERLVVVKDEVLQGTFVDLENKEHATRYYEVYQVGLFDEQTRSYREGVSGVRDFTVLKKRRFYEVCIYGGSKGDNPVLHLSLGD